MELLMRNLQNNRQSLFIKDAHLIWLNFAGVERQNNRAGERNFCVALKPRGESLEPAVANFCDKLATDGWNLKVKDYSSQNGSDKYVVGVDYNEEDLLIFLPVKVSFDHIPPKVFERVGENGKKIKLDESTIDELDYAEIENAMIEINPSQWKVNGKSGVKAYLKEAVFTISPSPFDDDFPQSPTDDDPEDYDPFNV